MRIADCELWRFSIPFKTRFSHAAATRVESDAIIVEIRTDAGSVGYGEIQARPYVTGEQNEEIWERHAPAIGRALRGASIERFEDIEACLGGAAAYAKQAAAIGGFDIALVDCLETEHGLDWAAVFGEPRTDAPEKCLTIGQGSSAEELTRQGRYARLTGCSVVKLKVAQPDDAANIEVLRAAIGDTVRIRLDANGEMAPDAVVELLTRSASLGIESIEEPVSKALPDLEQVLADLHRQTGVPIVADESMCTLADIDRFAGTGAVQVANVRVGKCGGVTGTARFLAHALASGFDVVSGTMVGETAVMLRISEKMLHHSTALDYVEGLDQASVLTEAQVIEPAPADGRRFGWLEDARDRYLTGHKSAD